MRRGGIIGGGLLAAVLAASAVADADTQRRHRLHLPTTPLGKTLSVDEFEFTLRPSKLAVAAGTVKIRVYNRGEDDHNLVVVDRAGVAHAVELKPATSGVVSAKLPRGRYKLYCSLFEGTPESHDAKGMHFTLTVR